MATTPITTIQIVHESDMENAASIDNAIVGQAVVDNNEANGIINRLLTFFASILVGLRNAKLVMIVENATAGIFAYGTITVTHANVDADDTLYLAGTTLTWKVAAGSENEITIGADLAGDVAALAAAINAHSVLGKFFSAAVTSAGVVTVTSKLPGLLGTLLTWSTPVGTWGVLLPTTKLGNVTSTQTRSVITLNKGVA